MILEQKSYRGVSCHRCGQPLPLSAKVVSLQDEIAQGKSNVPPTFSAPVRLGDSVLTNRNFYEI